MAGAFPMARPLSQSFRWSEKSCCILCQWRENCTQDRLITILDVGISRETKENKLVSGRERDHFLHDALNKTVGRPNLLKCQNPFNLGEQTCAMSNCSPPKVYDS